MDVRHCPPTTERDELFNYLDSLIKAAKHGTRIHCLILFDLDHFRLVNTVAGRAAGNACLSFFSQKLSDLLLEGDSLYFLGEDSFAVVCPYRDLSEIRPYAAALVERISKLIFRCGEEEFVLSASAGLAQADETDTNGECLFNRAESALYKAKLEGRSCSRSQFKPALVAVATDTINWAARFHHAFLHDGFIVEYEPTLVTDPAGNCVSQVMVYLSYQGERHDLRSLRVELASLEMLLAMDRWVLRTISERTDLNAPCLWRVSSVSVRAPEFARYLKRLSGTPGLAEHLWLGIAEADVRDGAEVVIEQFRQLGYTIVLLDFGSEANSLYNIFSLPVDYATPFPKACELAGHTRSSVVNALAEIAKAAGKKAISTPLEL